MDDPGGGGPISAASAGDVVSSPESRGPGGRPLTTKSNNKATVAQLEAYYSMFSGESQIYDKFFTITSADPNRPLTTINTIKANRDLEQFIGGAPEDVRELRSGSILVKVANNKQSENIQKLTVLAGCKVEVRSNDRMNQCKGTIYYRNDPNFTNAEIMAAINENSEARVVDIYRMKKKTNNNLVDLPIYILTFQSNLLPKFIKVGWTRCSTKQYIPRPRRCFKCQEFGHSIKTCRNGRICMQCSHNISEEDNSHPNPCNLTPKCPNCSEAHPASSRECPRYEKEQLVLNVQANEGLTYQAARRKVFKNLASNLVSNNRPLSSADAVKSNVRPNSSHKIPTIPIVNRSIIPEPNTSEAVGEQSNMPKSPVIHNSKFKNSTFGKLDNSLDNTPSPTTADFVPSRKRVLSDPIDLETRKSSNRQPSKNNSKKNKSEKRKPQ